MSRTRRLLTALAIASALVPVAVLISAQPAYAATEELRLNFDDPPSGQVEPGPWITGCFADVTTPADNGCVTVAGTGAVGRVTRPSGSGSSPAITFPAPGAGPAMLQVPHATYLNPGAADFTISAMVKLTVDQASPGANLVQKGTFASAGGQWKLQIDSGVPSCRIAGVRAGVAVSAIVSWGSSITGGGWKYVECKRRGAVLSISVAGGSPVAAVDDATMTIANTLPVTVGAKGVGANPDQFHGALDNVVFSTA
jgi:hypothetical protein